MIFGMWVGVRKTKVKFDDGPRSGFLQYCSGTVLCVNRQDKQLSVCLSVDSITREVVDGSL